MKKKRKLEQIIDKEKSNKKSTVDTSIEAPKINITE